MDCKGIPVVVAVLLRVRSVLGYFRISFIFVCGVQLETENTENSRSTQFIATRCVVTRYYGCSDVT